MTFKKCQNPLSFSTKRVSASNSIWRVLFLSQKIFFRLLVFDTKNEIFQNAKVPFSLQNFVLQRKRNQKERVHFCNEQISNLKDALIIQVHYHDRYLFQNQQLQHVHDLHAINDLQRRRNLNRNVNKLTNYVAKHSLLH